MNVAGRFHLTYCSNIHPGESWTEVSDALTASLPDVRRQLGVHGPMGVGLRLSAHAADTLAQPEKLEAFQQFLRAGDYYVPTINGFPHGAFHGERVKERVYRPDWRSPERLRYSNQLATILAGLLQDHAGIEGSVSTVPGAFRAEATTEADARAIAQGMLRHAAHLVALRQKTGIIIALAIEPEPACLMETTAEAVAFFKTYLFDSEAVREAGQVTGLSLAVEDVRRHLGVCADACHMAVEFENPDEAFALLGAAGIRVCKVQISSAIRVRNPVTQSVGRAALERFAENTYLHQVVARNNGRFDRYTDLPEALAAPDPEAAAADHEWRVHFHVPVFLEEMQGFDTTQAELRRTIGALKRNPVCACLEVETYTWDVLPPEYRTVDLCTAIARELAWVREQLEL